MQRVVIAGGGFSGAATAIDLCRRSPEPLDIRIIEPRERIGAGLAHSAPHPQHRLNGTPAIHAIHLDEPLHFANWLSDSGTLAGDPAATTPQGVVFARRADFGRYMGEEIARWSRHNSSGSRIEHVREAAIKVAHRAGALEVALSDGRTLPADRLVLALGWNETGVLGPLTAIADHPGWFGNPWDVERLSTIARQAPVLLIGAGLTAADTFAVLAAEGHQGPVLAVSRRGLRPGLQNPHRYAISVWQRLLDPHPDFIRKHGHPRTIRAALRALRAGIESIDPATSSWQVPFDELRDCVTHFWPAMPLAEKQRFVRHLKSRYDAARFRNPPQIQQIIDAGTASGQLKFMAARLQSARVAQGALEIDLDVRDGRDGRDRHDGSGPRTLKFAAVINCTGPQPRPSASGNALWRSLIADGLARDHPCGLGIDVDASYRLLDAGGQPQNDMIALGPPTLGGFGEAAAVPYIARQIFEATDQFVAAASGEGKVKSNFHR